jgi:hypothetical protein
MRVMVVLVFNFLLLSELLTVEVNLDLLDLLLVVVGLLAVAVVLQKQLIQLHNLKE